MTLPSKYLSARIGSHWFGVEVDQIIEVLHLVAFTEVPNTSDDIIGLITVRDCVMPLLDLRRRFAVSEAEIKLDTPIIALQDASGPLALLVDEADKVEEMDSAEITSFQQSQQFPYVSAVVQQTGRLLLLLDTHRLSKEIHQS